jgi:PelA/Pel-15E family pectate lyase
MRQILLRPRRLMIRASLLLGTIAPAFAAPAPHPWPDHGFTPVTPARIEALPGDRQSEWQAYWAASQTLLAKLPVRPHADESPLKPMAGVPKGGIHTKGLRLDESAAWYASEPARVTASRIAAAQMAIGAWPKGEDYTQDGHHVDPHSWGAGTFDNDATTSELTFLARVIAAAATDPRQADWRAAFERGLAYIFSAQYPNGGFPQVYPLIGGYHDAITYNDDAMINVLTLLRGISDGAGEFAFTAPALRQEAAGRLERGLRCILATQLRDARQERTVWCQQYDALTLRPCAARNFEPVADCARESASITLFLLRSPTPSAEIIAAVDGAVAWFRRTALKDLKIRRAPGDVRGEAVPAPGAPLLWARFYEPGTTTPIFGERDRTIHYDLKEISPERVAGYAWYTDAPRRVLKEYDRWRAKVGAAK